MAKGLELKADDVVLSITSGGDNALFLLLGNPEKIISIDSNPTQNYLLELKLAAAKILNYQEFLEFLGVRKSTQRLKLFEKVKSSLSLEAREWWNSQPSLISVGLINCGRFEKFLRIFSAYILPLAHSKEIVNKFLNTTSLKAQQEFFSKIWDSKRWKLLFKIITSRFVLKYFARGRGMFDQNKMQVVAKEYQRRFDKCFTHIALLDNYYMTYCLTGEYNTILPAYLEQSNFIQLKEQAEKLSIATNNIFSYLKLVPDNTFTKFNLSDIFEALSPEMNKEVWQEIIRTAKNGARVAYWNNLVPRSFPPELSDKIQDEKIFADNLFTTDRVFFYGSFHIQTILK